MNPTASISGKYYSAEEAPPSFNPIAQFVLGYGGMAAMAGAAAYTMNNVKSKKTGVTQFDILERKARNIAEKSPLGILNTFRISEFSSAFLSPFALGLDIDLTKRVGRFEYSAEQITGSNVTLDYMRKLLGTDFEKLTPLTKGVDIGNYKLAYEQSLDEIGQGNLFLEEYEDAFESRQLDDGSIDQIKSKKLKSKKLISDKLALMNLNYQSDLFDIVLGLGKQAKINPAFVSVLQSIGFVEDLNKAREFDQLFAGKVIDPSGSQKVSDKAAFGLIPSLKKSEFSTQLKLMSSYLNFGFNRFNKLLTSTADQVPVLGDAVSKVANALNINLRTRPGPFYKQFTELGMKVAKAGAMYGVLQTVDHYRRNFDFAGHILASGAIGIAAETIYNKSFKQSERSFTKRGQVAGMVMLGQMLPGFSEGIVEGFATSFANLDIARSYIGKFSLMSTYRRTLEGFMPGISDPTIGVAAGIGLAVAAYNNVGANRLIEAKDPILPEYIRNRIGFTEEIDDVLVPYTQKYYRNNALFDILYSPGSRGGAELDKYRSKVDEAGRTIETLNPVWKGREFDPEIRAKNNQNYYEIFESHFEKVTGQTTDKFDAFSSKHQKALETFITDNYDILREISPDLDNLDKTTVEGIINPDFLSKVRALGSGLHYQAYHENNPLNYALLDRLVEIKERNADRGMLGKASEIVESFGAQIYHAFHGASMEGDQFDAAVKELGLNVPMRRLSTLVLGGFLMHQVATGALIGTMESPDDLRKEYSGEKMVEVKKGRWWEGGGTPYHGKETEYFRPSQYSMLMAHTQEKAVWGDEFEKYNPITRFFLKNFTYHLERKNYDTRPYPLTSAAFEDIPVIGPLLANTIGKLFKPPKLMHTNEIMRINDLGEVEFLYEKEPGSSPELGALPPGKPVSPYSLESLYGSVQYQFRELEGLTGFVKNQFQKVTTGQETFGMTKPVFATSGAMDSSIMNYWDMDLGGALFMSEPVRRLLPAPRSEIQQYNPITNSMPTWLPDKFKSGDPYTKIKMGHARLPGEGYEALHPDIAGFDPEDYPLVHKYNILSNVAPTSPEVVSMREELFQRRAKGLTSDTENRIMDEATRVLQKQLAPIRDYERENALKIPVISNVTSTMYDKSMDVLRTAAQPIEFLIPAGFRPTQKLLGEMRSPVEQYEYERLYATPHAFWNEPWRDWIRPSALSLANMMGYEGKPLHVQEREEINEYYDKLQFMKYMNLANTADNARDRKRFLGIASRTRYGVNGTGDAMSIYMALPEEERKFFNSFAMASNEDRERIREMVPEDQKHLYEAVWSQVDSGNYASLYSEGLSELNEQQLQQKYQEVGAYFQDYDVPNPDWIGWHKDVDINDIKIKYLDDAGAQLRDYDLWQSQAKRVRRQPYLEDSYQFMYGTSMPTRSVLARTINDAAKFNGINYSSFALHSNNDPFGRSMSYLTVNDNRQTEINRLVQTNLSER